ncbi:MAG: glycosyltransferase [Firmicutes bacterium]|nr:glycosyltransferase [Bacillota bacterium]
MRIMIGSESFYPNISGVAVATENMAAYMASQGHEVLVLAPSTSHVSGQELNPEGFSVQRLGSVPNPFRKGFRVTLHPYRQIKGLVDAWQPDIIHLQDPTSIGSCLLKAARTQAIPVVISHHFTLEYILSYFWYLKPLHRRFREHIIGAMIDFYNSCQYVICPSESVQQWLLAVGVKVPVAAVSNGVNLNRFFSYELPACIRSDWGLPELPIVLYVGRIDQDKSLDTLLDAVPLVLSQHPAHFIFCGGGNLLARLRRKSEQEDFSKQVTFLGQLDHQAQELPRLYQIATCFVIPSRYETQSIVTMEAMASGLPVVAAAAGALPELVGDGDNGYLFTPGDASELADKILLILTNPELALHMGQRSLEKVVQHDLNRNLNKIEQIYDEVIKDEKE